MDVAQADGQFELETLAPGEQGVYRGVTIWRMASCWLAQHPVWKWQRKACPDLDAAKRFIDEEMRRRTTAPLTCTRTIGRRRRTVVVRPGRMPRGR